MSWTAVVPLKTRGERKSRLAELLSAEERAALSIRMFRHVVDVLADIPAIGRIVVLADQRPAGWDSDWIADSGRGLNAELHLVRKAVTGDLIVLHADLPLLGSKDVIALIAAAARRGLAIAPDRHGTGTNSIAIKGGEEIDFAFGADSYRLHRKQCPDAEVVKRGGFELDLDTKDDLKIAESLGVRVC